MPSNLILSLAAVILAASANACTDSFYTAAVFEHAMKGNWSTDTAEEILKTNLGYYETAAKAAKTQGADIVVFPEYGIFPFGDRQIMKRVIEFIPDPKVVLANPCQESEEFSNRPILTTLSCMARNNSIVVVANMADIQPCQQETGCPDDGHFHFNTNVAFDSNGTLIGRYHKEHLFFESGMDLPTKQQDPTFETEFGKFAMFICFDIVFKRITEVARLDDVEAILLPTMWIDPTPLMTSVQIWQSWAMGNNITFMAANIQIPGYFAVGSGIFYGREGPIAYTYNPDGLSKLIVAQVPKRQQSAHVNATRTSTIIITRNGTENYTNDGDKVPTVCSRKILGEAIDPRTEYRCLEEDISQYTLIKLNNTRDNLQACNNGVCCSLNYIASDMQENFYFGVYNGTYNMFDRYFWSQENCLLVRCDPFGDNPCATFPMRSKTKFSRVHISGNFTAEHIYPSVLGSGIRLVSTNSWKYGLQPSKAFVNFDNGAGKELIVVGLNGRCYDRDPPYIR